MRVLVVDDQPDAALALCDLLGALGVGSADSGGIDHADDGDTALAMIQQAEQLGRPYDLMLMDWVMPRVDGAEVLRVLNARAGARSPLPVIVSAYDSETIHRTAEALGARHFVAKPVLPESLRDLIKWLAGDQTIYSPLQPRETETGELAGLRALLVEDNPINRQLAAELLQGKGAEVEVAGNGREAIENINAYPPNHYSVVLMDLQMPVMDGYEATRLLRLDARYVNLPIVAVSAHAMAQERERCQVLGMNGHISKPIDPVLLYATLAQFNLGGATPRPGPTPSEPLRDAAPPVTGHADLPQIAGLDTRAGLHHADGNRSLYVQLLRQFALDYAEFATSVEPMLARGAWNDATREAHTLKGLSASLGANELQPVAAALEKAARAHDAVEARRSLAEAGERLAALNAGLRLFFDVAGAAEPDPPDCSTAVAAVLPEWLPRFRDLLRQADVESKELWDSRHAEIAGLVPDQVMQRIALALERFDFDTALRWACEDCLRESPDLARAMPE